MKIVLVALPSKCYAASVRHVNIKGDRLSSKH